MVNFEQGTLLRVGGSLYYVSELLVESEHCLKDGTDRQKEGRATRRSGGISAIASLRLPDEEFWPGIILG
jgi:hypothetical protein